MKNSETTSKELACLFTPVKKQLESVRLSRMGLFMYSDLNGEGTQKYPTVNDFFTAITNTVINEAEKNENGISSLAARVLVREGNLVIVTKTGIELSIVENHISKGYELHFSYIKGLNK
jgi:hypothetical protein